MADELDQEGSQQESQNPGFDPDTGSDVLEHTAPIAADNPNKAPDEAKTQPEATPQKQQAPAFSSWDDLVSKNGQVGGPKYKSWNEMVEKEQPTIQSALMNYEHARAHPEEMSDAQRIWAQNNYIGSVFKAFGQGYKEDFTQEINLDPETVKSIQDLGAWKGFSDGEKNINNGFMDSTIVPYARNLYENFRHTFITNPILGAADLANKIQTTVGTAPFAGLEAAAEQIGTETGTGEALPAAVEYFGTTADGIAAMDSIHNLRAYPKAVPPLVAGAKAAGVLEDEAVFSGVKPPTEAQTRDMTAAAHEAKPLFPYLFPKEEPKDIHAVAREVNPQLFEQYDALSARRDSLADQLRQAGQKRKDEAEAASPFSDDIISTQDKLDNADNTRKQKIYQNRLNDLLEKHEDWVNEKIKEDTPELAEARAKYQEADYKIRDMAVDVSSAYRKAETMMPKEELTVEKYVNDYIAGKGRDSLEHQQFAANNGAEIEKEFQRRAKDEPEKPIIVGQNQEETNRRFGLEIPTEKQLSTAKDGVTRSLEDQHEAIASDVAKKLTDIGRTADESRAIGELIASHYRAVAEQGWAKGTPQEIYERHSAEIKEGKTRSRVLAQVGSRDLKQKTKGKITLGVGGAKNIISMFKTADASTFIHELGHHWLDEMVRFASEEDAPQALRDHVDTVKNWLGVSDMNDIPTRAHEKFARGFERYMMEGIAPSKNLANVFAQFKQWLGKIYQTVDRLKAPITDDIRNVFDRFLSSNPEKQAVVAPEHAPGKMLADIHTSEAVETEPAKAASVADNIEKEIQSTVKQHLPEIEDALKPASTEATGGAEQAANPPADVPEPKSSATDQGTTEKSDQIAVSGSGAAPEGTAARAVEEPKPPERGSNEVFRRPPSELADKAGNIRLDNLNQPDDVDSVIRQTAAENQDFITARRGVIPDAMASDLADALGMDLKKLNLRKIGEAFNAEQIIAARKLLVQSAIATRDAMMKAANGSDEDVMKYAEARYRHQMIQEHISGITAEAGRALRAFRELPGDEEAKGANALLSKILPQDKTGRSLYQLKREARLGAALDTPSKVSKFVNDSKKPSFGTMLLEYWINGLISGPATHATYAVGNLALMLNRLGPETLIASGLNKLNMARGAEDSGVRIGEIGAKLKGAIQGVPTGLSAAGSALKTGVTSLLPGEKPWTLPFQTAADIPITGEMIPNKNYTWKEVGSQLYGAIQGMRDAFVAQAKMASTDADLFELQRSQLGAIPNLSVKGITLPIGEIFRLPARSVAAIHSFFRTVNYSIENSALAYRTAIKEGLTGSAFDSRVAELRQNPTEEMMTKAKGGATEATLMARGGDFTQALSRLTNVSADLSFKVGDRQIGLGETKLLKFIDPFVHISSNVIDQAILQRTPIGLLSKDIREDLSGVHGEDVKQYAQARMLWGTALAVTAGTLAAEGYVSGSGPDNPKDRAAWIAAGNQPHSIKINDVWYDIHRLGPIGMTFSTGADMYHVAHALDTESASKAAATLVHAISQNILDESFMRGPSDLILAVTEGDRYGEQYIRNFASSFVPFSVGMSQAARATDPYVRQARTVMDAVKAKIPWESQTLMPKRDVFGEPIKNRDVLGPKGLSSIYETKVNHDPVIRAMGELGCFPAQPERKIRGVQMNDQQYDDFSRIAGRLAKARLDNFVAQPGFANIPPGAKVQVMRKLVESSRKSAQAAIMMKYPEIMQQAIEQKHKILMGEK